MAKSILSALVLFAFTLGAQCQESESNREYGASFFGGYFMAHHPGLTYLRERHISGFDLSISKRADGSKDWHHAFNFPSTGLTFSAADLGSSDLGKALSVRWFLDLSLVPKKWLGLRLDLGAAYIEKPFARYDNIHNSAIGSKINAALEAFIYGKIKLGNHIDLKPGIGLQHFSNGAYKAPNSGINIGMVKVSMVYHGYTRNIERKKVQVEKTPFKYYVGTSFGVKEISPIGGQKYGIVNIYGQATKRVTQKSSFGGEIGLNYNSSLDNRMERIEKGSGDPSDNYRFYIAGTHQFHFDPFGIRFQAGAYIAPKFTEDAPVFFRYHIFYELPKIQIFFGLKSHFAKADNAELGINYRLN